MKQQQQQQQLFKLILMLMALVEWSSAYSAYQREASSGGYSSRYTSSSSSYSSGSSSINGLSGYTQACCQLNSWAYGHMDEVRQFANRLRQEYNSMSQGSSTGYSFGTQWNANIIELTGKTATELEALIRRVSEQLVTDMRKGILTYAAIAQPNFFEWKASQILEINASSAANLGQQQQQMLDFDHLSNYDEIKNYAYPTEIKVIDGKTYVVHKNCTEATKTTGQGGVYGTNNGFISGSMVSGTSNSRYPGIYIQPGGSTTTTTVKKTIYDWEKKNMEPTVIGYNPVINIGSDWTNTLNTYKPPVHIPVDTGMNSNIENLNSGSHTMFQPDYSPGSTVTIRRYNKTTITNPGGQKTFGSEVNQKWVDGHIVYDYERPFGEWTVPRDEKWKTEERERFFWLLSQGDATAQKLEEWQRQQEERLIGVAERYHITLDDIHEWHKKELERYRVLLGFYHAQNEDLTNWKRIERGRLDWLIHQNSVTREELERWQRDNQDKLMHLARQYQISLNELKNWQIEELNRLYVYFNDQNNSMMTRPLPDSLHNSEQERLEELIRQHNATIDQLHNSIKLDQQKLVDLSHKYRGNVEDMEKWLKSELARLGGIINEQRNEMTRITEWQRSERERLENTLKQHRGSVTDLESQMANDRHYMQSLANKYRVSIEELEKWQRAELERLHNEGQSQLETNILEWQKRERAHLMSIIRKNDLTIEEFQTKIMNDRERLENLAKTYQIQVSEVEEWIKNEIKNFQSQGLLKEVEKELALWQQKERDRLLSIVQQNEYTIEELEKKIKNDQSHLSVLANTYKVDVHEIEEWLKSELLRLQNEGLIKMEDLQEWQKNERNQILKIVQQNRLTIEEFEMKLLADRQRLNDLSKTYNVQTSEIETWIKKEGERLQSLGLLQIQEQLNNWQKIERDRLIALIQKNNFSISELEEKIKNDQVHLYSLAHQHQVRVEEIEEWIKKEIKRLQQEGILEMAKLKDWQTEWRGNLTSMVKERDFTVEEFHKWLIEDRARLQALAMQHNVQIEEIEQWIKNEAARFVSMGLLKPNEKLTNWQEIERRYLERITQERYHSSEQLEQRLRQDRELLEKLARDYSVQVEEIEKWMKKELSRLRDDGQLQIDNLTAWQIAERERLEALIAQNKQWSVEELEVVLRQDRDHMQKMAFQYHTSVEEIEKWVQSEVERLRQQGKLDIAQLTAWQKTEQQRIMNLLQLQSSITVEEFEHKIQQDRNFLNHLASQYNVRVVEIEEFVKKVIEDLRKQGKFAVENLQAWQLVERDYIKQLIAQYNNGLTTAEFEQKLLADRTHLRQLADQYRINIDQIEKWMVEELKRLRKDSANQLHMLATWQVAEVQRLKDLIKQNNHLSYVEFEVELIKERARLQELAKQYSLNVEEVEQWLRQQLINLKTTGEIQVENLTQWQETEQKRLIALLLQQQHDISYEEFEKQLQKDRLHLEMLAKQYSISVEQIEQWMRGELQRLKNSGVVQVEELSHWQQVERERLQNWLKQQNDAATYEQFEAFLKRDKERLQKIAVDYQITIEEVESWVLQEGARLKILAIIESPVNFYVNDMWKEHTRAHLESICRVRPMSRQDFEKYLIDNRWRWEQFAHQYHITVEEIEMWLRQTAQNLSKDGLIQGNTTVIEWQQGEKLHIQNLIETMLRKQQQWSFEELQRHLKNDQQHLQQLAIRYHITVEEIEAWYRQELQRLRDQGTIVLENLNQWQAREKDRIYWIVKKQPGISIQSLEQILLQDRKMLNSLADEYHVSIEELEYWIRKEFRRLINLGLVRDFNNSAGYNKWQQEERERLRTIAAEIKITEEEFVALIDGDNAFQQQLIRNYGCSLDQLVPFQRIEINVMQREGVLDNIKVLNVQKWQREERDRLYTMIKNQNFTLKNLKDWQRQDSYLNQLAANHEILVKDLKAWQVEEFERLIKLAEYYRMSINQLQDFRDKELAYILYVMHKKYISEGERLNWNINEAKRIEGLRRMTGYTENELTAWRRNLYLLCQGLLPMDFGGPGGHENGTGTTNVTNIPRQVISKDRGDQPPNVYDENVDIDEPGLAGANHLYPQPPAQMVVRPTAKPPGHYLPPGNSGSGSAPGGTGGIQSGYKYSKKEYKVTVPVASASATADANGASSSASIGTRYGRHQRDRANFNGMESHSLTADDNGQQQEQEAEDWGQQQQEDIQWNERFVKKNDDQQQQQEDIQWNERYVKKNDGQQQQQEDIQWNERYVKKNDGQQQQQEDIQWNERYVKKNDGQQQQQIEGEDLHSRAHNGKQIEDFGQQQQVELDDYKQGEFDQQQQVQVEDLTGTFTTRENGASQKNIDATNTKTNVQAEPEPSFWGKVKQKTTDLFG